MRDSGTAPDDPPSLASTPEVEALQERIRHLETALDSSRDIGAAVGILMERHSLNQPVAFALLARVSQDLNTPIRDLARSLVDTGVLPTRPPSRTSSHHRRDRQQRQSSSGQPVTAGGSTATPKDPSS